MATVQIPSKLLFLLNENWRYKVAYGGRGAAKSYAFADSCIVKALQKPIRILCARQLQTSIKDSVHKLICDRISALNLNNYFYITKDSIKCTNGSEFIFKGIQNNISEIKSMEGISICWCFPAGTKVGNKNIENIKVGQFVDSYNHKTNEIEKKKVLRIMKRKMPKNLIKVLTHDGSQYTIATEEHPFYVKGKGYIKAKDLKAGDIVYEKVRFTENLSVLRWVWDRITFRETLSENKICEIWRVLLSRLCKEEKFRENEKTKSYVKFRNEEKDDKETSLNGAQTNDIRGEWKRLYASSENTCKRAWKRLVARITDTNGTLQGRERPSDKLQSGYSKHLLWHCDRIRRELSSREKSTNRRRKENKILREQRVESVEILESSSLKRFGLSDGGNYVYNLEVQGNNNYFANGLLVHNCEEAQSVSEESWETLIPTIRKENSEIWVSFNPDRDEDSTYQRFVVNPPRDCKTVLINYMDNPWFPEVLRKEMEYCKEVDYGKYEHVWLGKTVINTEAQVYHDKFEMKDFETPEGVEFFWGVDWGFAADSTAITRCFIKDQCLYVDYEAGGVGIEFEELPRLFESIPDVHKWQIRADNARPETISYVKRQGFNIVACPKWKGSVEDGVEYIRSFRRIYVHTRCPNTYNEFKFYSYKQDRNTGQILPIILDKDNHYLDSLRYGLNPYIQKNVSILDVL